MITQQDFEQGKQFKLKLDTGIFWFELEENILNYEKDGKNNCEYTVITIDDKGFILVNPFKENFFIYYEYESFNLI